MTIGNRVATLLSLGALLALGVAAVAAKPTDQAADSLVLELTAGKYDRANTPVVCTLPESTPQAIKDAPTLRLVRLDTQQTVNVQRLSGSPTRVVWIVREPLKAGATRRYRLSAGGGAAQGKPVVTCRDDGKHLLLEVRGKPVLRYNHAAVESPPGLPEYYRRSGYIHPLFSPAGQVITGDFAPDHAHQHGLFFAWVNSTFEGRNIDFWNQKKQGGNVEHVAIDGTIDGPIFAQFQVTLRHSDTTSPEGPVPVLDETWTVRAYSVADHFLFDVKSEQRCAGETPLTINQYHYGGMAMRGNSAWLGGAPNAGASDFLTSEGKGRATGNHTRPDWVELFGKLDGTFCGVAVMGHPGNFRYPQPVRLHPNKPYFCFIPAVTGPFAIEPDRPYVSRFRYVVHTGRPDAEANRRVWRDYAEPPEVRVVATASRENGRQ